MTKNFIPFDSDEAAAFAASVGAPFNTPENFVTLYNSGLINKKDKRVVDLVGKVTSLYKDVREIGGELSFVAPEEVFLSEIAKTVDFWITVSAIKREIQFALTSQKLDAEDVLFFSSLEGTGWIFKEGEAASDKPLKVSREKLFASEDQIAKIHTKFSGLPATGTDSATRYRFKISDFLDIDESWIGQVLENMPRA